MSSLPVPAARPSRLSAAIFAALSLFLLACPRPAAAQNNPPTCDAQLIHNPYMPGVGSSAYASDVLHWYMRLRFHLDTKAVTATSDAWTFVEVRCAWLGSPYAVPPSGGYQDLDGNWYEISQIKYVTYSPPGTSWHAKTKFIGGPQSEQTIDGFRDVGFGFLLNHGPAEALALDVVSTMSCNFHFRDNRLVRVGQGWQPVINDIWIVKSFPVNKSTVPNITTASRDAAPKRTAPQVALYSAGNGGGRFTRMMLVPMVPLTEAGVTATGKTVATAATGSLSPEWIDVTESSAVVNSEMADSVVAGVVTVMANYFAANPLCYAQDGTQQTSTLAWPAGTQY